jgi:hypothetical protein
MTWKDDLNYGLSAFGIQLPERIPLDEWSVRLSEQPARNTALLVALSSLAFYAVERDHNPKVDDIFDALVYTSTCLSVGYGDIFARTPLGKLLGSGLMMYGPGLVSHTSDPDTRQRDAVQAEILTTLKQLLEQSRQRAGGT